MSALTLLLACVVDLPAFVGSSESTTMATGDTSQPSETTGPTGGSSDTASTGTMGPTGSSMPPTGDTGRAAPSCTFEAAAAGPGTLAPAAALDSFDLHSYAIAMAGGGPKGQDALWYLSLIHI